MDTVTELPPEGSISSPDPRRFRSLTIVAIAQLMIVLDASVVTIALPSAQRALHISTANRQWALTAYTLAFGGLLLLGGRVADLVGRKRVFVISLIGFAASSALGGLAVDSGMLFGARALQGAFAALMAPSSLSLLTVMFTEPKERATAFGVFGGISGGGAAIGLILGGSLTQYASWRWTLLINVPIAIVTAVVASRLLRESRSEHRSRIDFPGAALSTIGLLSLVYGFTKAATDGWASDKTLLFLAVGRGVPRGVRASSSARSSTCSSRCGSLLDPNRGGSFLGSTLVGIALLGTFLSLTYYLQATLHYSALKTGFAFLPFSGGIIVSAAIASQLLPRLGPKTLVMFGTVLGAVGLYLFTKIGVDGDYVGRVLPAEVLLSFGMGFAFVPNSSTALIGVGEHDAGVASALVNTTQQVGGSLGTSLLNTVSASSAATFIAANGAHSVARGLVHGYTTAFERQCGGAGRRALRRSRAGHLEQDRQKPLTDDIESGHRDPRGSRGSGRVARRQYRGVGRRDPAMDGGPGTRTITALLWPPSSHFATPSRSQVASRSLPE